MALSPVLSVFFNKYTEQTIFQKDTTGSFKKVLKNIRQLSNF